MRAPLTLGGVGVHSGLRAVAEIRPASFGTGLRVNDLDVHIDNVTGDAGCTVLGDVTMVEHLLCALVCAGITDAEVRVDGPEVPILDGSARPWLDGIADVGLEDGPPIEPWVPPATRVEEGSAWAELVPGDPVVDVSVEWDDERWPRSRVATPLSEVGERAGWARTFVLERDVQRLRAAGRGKGATEDNTLLVRPEMPPELVDEVVCHKVIDAVGDLALAGRPVRALLRVHRGSHRLHHALIRASRPPSRVG